MANKKRDRERQLRSIHTFLYVNIVSNEKHILIDLENFYENHVEHDLIYLSHRFSIQEKINLGLSINEKIDEIELKLKDKKNLLINKPLRSGLLAEMRNATNRHLLSSTRQIREIPLMLWNGKANKLADIFWKLSRELSKEGKPILLNSKEEIAEFLMKNFSVFQDMKLNTITTMLSRTESPMKQNADKDED